MTGCSYCGRPGCGWETCPKRLEDRHGLPSDYDDEGQLKTDGGAKAEVGELSLEELREEYQNLLEQSWGLERLTDEDRTRLRNLWNELEDRTGVEQPECPECGARDWGQSPGDPKHCNGCHLELGMNHIDLVEEIDAAWEQILHAESNGGESA